MPIELTFNQEQLKEYANKILEISFDTINSLQPVIQDCDMIYNYLKDDPLMRKYSGSIGQLFGSVNTLTVLVDSITTNMNDVVDGLYDSYPNQSVAAMMILWDETLYSALAEISKCVIDTQQYIKIFEYPDMGIDKVINGKTTIH